MMSWKFLILPLALVSLVACSDDNNDVVIRPAATKPGNTNPNSTTVLVNGEDPESSPTPSGETVTESLVVSRTVKLMDDQKAVEDDIENLVTDRPVL
jgi:hypothetical protein